MSAQSITNAIGRITVNPSKNIPVSTQIVEAVTNYLNKNNIEDPERAMAIISTIMSDVRKKGEALLQQTREGKYGSEKARTRLQDGIRGSIDMIENRLNKIRNDYVAQNQPVPANIGIVIPMRLEEIQQRLRIFQKNQKNTVEFSQMQAEATQLLNELNQIQRRLPSSESTVYGHKIKVAVRGLNRHIERLKVSLTHFINFFGRMKATKAPEYEASVAAARNPETGRSKNLSFEERVAELRNLSYPKRGTKKEPGEIYFAPGGKRKTRKRRRRRKRKTRKHRKKKRTRRRKPKKRHRRTRRR